MGKEKMERLFTKVIDCRGAFISWIPGVWCKHLYPYKSRSWSLFQLQNFIESAFNKRVFIPFKFFNYKFFCPKGSIDSIRYFYRRKALIFKPTSRKAGAFNYPETFSLFKSVNLQNYSPFLFSNFFFQNLRLGRRDKGVFFNLSKTKRGKQKRQPEYKCFFHIFIIPGTFSSIKIWGIYG